MNPIEAVKKSLAIADARGEPYVCATVGLTRDDLRATVEALERAEQERDCWKAICAREDGYHQLHVREAVRLLDMEKCRAAATQTNNFIRGMQDEREEQRARAERAEADAARLWVALQGEVMKPAADRQWCSLCRVETRGPNCHAAFEHRPTCALALTPASSPGFACGRCAECDGGRGAQFCVSPRARRAPDLLTRAEAEAYGMRVAEAVYLNALAEFLPDGLRASDKMHLAEVVKGVKP